VLGLLAVIALLAANAVFVAGEFSLVAVDRASIGSAATGGDRRARLVLSLQGRLSFYLSGAQLGMTLTSLLLGFAAAPVLGHVLESPVRAVVGPDHAATVAKVVGFAAAIVAQLVLAELIPKNVAVARPRRVAYALAPILRAYGIVFKPVIVGLDRLTRTLVRALGVEPRTGAETAYSSGELARLVAASGREGTLDPEAARLLTRSLRFSDKTAADALVPRTAVTAIERGASARALASLAVSSGYSRFPVVDDGLDRVVGVVLAKDVLRVPPADRDRVTVAELAAEVLAVPETRDLESLLAEMRESRRQLVVVLDEFGDTAGIVTVEDLVEEIVGEIEDEYDEPVALTRGLDGTVVLDGTARAEEVQEACGLELPDRGDYETIAGFVLELLQRIPVVGDVAEWHGWRVTVLEMERHRIARVSVSAPPAEPGGGS